MSHMFSVAAAHCRGCRVPFTWAVSVMMMMMHQILVVSEEMCGLTAAVISTERCDLLHLRQDGKKNAHTRC